jgi:hypothetical protein
VSDYQEDSFIWGITVTLFVDGKKAGEDGSVDRRLQDCSCSHHVGSPWLITVIQTSS